MKHIIFTFAICLTLLLLFSGCSTSKKSSKEIDPAFLNVKSNEYFIDSGDTINIFVYDHPELSQEILVPPAGKITYPFIGDLTVKDLTIFQVRDHIRDELGSGYIPNPQVAVNIKSIAGKKIHILGEIKAPKVLRVQGELHAIEAVTMAGGFTVNANRKAVLLIRELEDNKRIMDVLNLEKFLKESDLRENRLLKRGDIIYVPPSFIANVDRFFLHLSNILSPIKLNIMEGIILYPRVKDALRGNTGGGIQIE